jgi:RHS repeat-associated protein
VNSGTATYVYDSEGHRVGTVDSTRGQVSYYYDLDAHIVFEGSTGRIRMEYYVGGRHLVTYSATTVWNFPNWLGTEHFRSTITGSQYEYCLLNPFGDAMNCQANEGDLSRVHFTGKERDSYDTSDLTNLDNFGARYYSSNMARFMSPDPSNLSVDFWLPQTWNRYAYTLNNPLAFVDRNGLWPTWIHEQIIDQAFPGMSAGDLQTLKDASHNMDYGPGQQDAALSFEHGMRNGSSDTLGGETATDAANQAAAFIADQENRAQQIQADWLASGHTGIAPAALTAFGNALHTIEDEISPAHEGFQPWYGESKFSPLAWIHFFRESYISESKRRQAISRAQQAYWKTFGYLRFLEVMSSRACVSANGPQGTVTQCTNQ